MEGAKEDGTGLIYKTCGLNIMLFSEKYNCFLHKTPAVEYLIEVVTLAQLTRVPLLRDVSNFPSKLFLASPSPSILDPLLHLQGGEGELKFNKLSDLREKLIEMIKQSMLNKWS